jgi:poly(hydroxyalkanoate) depolymerase family esterase
MSIDWQRLYASNRAAIEAAGVRAGGPADPTAAVEAGVRAGRLPDPVGALGAAGVRAGRIPGAAAALEALRGMRAGAGPGGAGGPAAPCAGGRRAVLHAPPGADAHGPVPLVVLLHGCTQNAASFAAATGMDAAADRHGFATLHLEQGRERNAQGCWNWFAPEHQGRDGGEPAWMAAEVREALATSPVALDPARVFVAGLSAGGAMAAVLAHTHPELVAGIAVHSGLAPGAAHDVPSAFTAMRQGSGGSVRAGAVPTLVIHGTADRTVAPVNGEELLGAALAASRAADPAAAGLRRDRPDATDSGHAPGGLAWTRASWTDASGGLLHELLLVDGLGHAWSGGTAGGSFTDPRGPSATDAALRFFAQVARDRASGRELAGHSH